MTTPNGAPPDCRCAQCGTCYHDHAGWNHQWEMTTPKGDHPYMTTPNSASTADMPEVPVHLPGEGDRSGRPFVTHTGLERPILVDTEAAAVYAGRKVTVIYRWAGEGRLTRYGTRGKGNALWDVRELTHWASGSGDPMPSPPSVKPQNFQDRA